MIFRKILHPIFLIPFLVYALNRLWIRPSGFTFADYYLNDLLCMPIVLYLAAVLMEWFYRIPLMRLSAYQVVAATLYMGLVFEWLLPKYSSMYSADPLDILMYILGGIAFLLLQKFRKPAGIVYPSSKSR